MPITVCRRAILAVAFILPLALPAMAQDQEVRFAVTDIEGLEALQREFGPFESKIEELTGFDLELFAVNSRTVAAEALRAEQVDFVLTGPAEYVVMRKLTNAEPVIAFSRPDYFSAIVVMADSPYQRPEDLRGETIAFGDIGSTSNHLSPAQLLADYGLIYRDDYDVQHTSRDIGHEAMKRGDVAALATNYRSWLLIREAEELPPGAFRAMARSGDLPNDVLVAAPNVADETVKTMRTAFEEHSEELIEAILSGGDENLKYEGMRFLPGIQDSDYDYVRAMYATIGFPEFAEFVGD